MALEQKLSLKLSQRLVMTPSLQQAIKLLQMTRMELETTVAQELETNPILEEIEEESTEEEEREASAEADTAPEKAEAEEVPQREALQEIAFETFLGESWEHDGGASGEWEPREAAPLENTLTHEPDLYDHLLWQIHMSDFPPEERAIAETIVGNLDPDGFLVASVEDICRLGREGEGDTWTEEQVAAVLERVRRLDPPGIACTNLRESLLLQLDLAGEPEDSLARRIVSDHWDAFLRRQYPAIARVLGVQLADLEPALEEAAATLGAGRWTTLRRVVLPEIAPAATTGFVLALARGLGEYGSVIFIAGNLPMKSEITALLIMVQLEQYDYAAATGIALVFLIASFALLLLLNGLSRRGRMAGAA